MRSALQSRHSRCPRPPYLDEGIDVTSSVVPMTDTTRPTLTRSELHRLVRYWVGMLKEAGLPPEEVLIAVKSLVHDTVVPRYSRYADPADHADARIAFVRDASQWCIEAYFEDVPEPNDPAADILRHRHGSSASRCI